MSTYTVKVLHSGYSYMKGPNEMIANCSCTLIKGPKNIIVDTMTSWDAPKILEALKKQNLTPDEINFVVSTHGHSDHIGNNNLFLKATHIVGYCISQADRYFLHPFDTGADYVIDEYVKITPTPGHTLTDVTVTVRTELDEIVAITGDLFECYEDIDNPSRWMDAGSEMAALQRQNRSRVANLANWIIPGHGKMFQVNQAIRDKLEAQLNEK